MGSERLYRLLQPGEPGIGARVFRGVHHAAVAAGVGIMLADTVDASRLAWVDALDAGFWIVCSFFAAVGSIVLTARVASGQPTLGVSLPLESVAAVVLGGVSLFGGRGSVIGVAFGVAFVSILSNGLNLLNVSSYTQMMVIGGALILAVAMDQIFVRRRNSG